MLCDLFIFFKARKALFQGFKLWQVANMLDNLTCPENKQDFDAPEIAIHYSSTQEHFSNGGFLFLRVVDLWRKNHFPNWQ